MQVAAARPELNNLRLGSATLAPSVDVGYKLVTADRPLGDAAGYDSLETATASLRDATRGSESLAGVFEVDGRYYGQAVDVRYRPVGPNGERYAWRQEQFDAESSTIDLLRMYRQGDQAQSLVRLVDGDLTLYDSQR